MIKLAPSLLSADFARLKEEIEKIEAGGADWIHVDVMDGHFVPNITIGPPVVKSLRKVSKLPFDVHLMIEKPERYLADFVEAGADILTVHWEACPHLHRTVQRIKELGARAGVSINPATPVILLKGILNQVDLILVMSVNPGFGGQAFIPSSLEKIRELNDLKKRYGLGFEIEVDGGINLDNAKEVAEAGATVLVAGSAVFTAPSVENRVKQFKQLFPER